MARYQGNKKLLNNLGVLVEGFEDVTDWANYGSNAAGFAIAANTSDFNSGSQSLTFSATGTGIVRYNRYNAVGVDLSDVDTFSMWVKWDRVSSSSNISLYISSDGNATFVNYKALTVLGALTGSARLDGGAICLTWKKSDMTITAGSIDWSNVTNLNILCNMQGAGESCSIDSLYCGRRTRPKAVMFFDDGVEDANFSQLTHAGVALGYGIPVTFGLIPELVDGTGYLTTAQLTTLKSNGHFMCGHSQAGVSGDYPAGNFTQAQVLADIQETQSFLRSAGFSDGVNYFIWPGGAYFDTSPEVDYLPAARDAGIIAARSITGVVQTNNAVEKINVGLVEPLVINAASLGAGLVAMKGYVDKAVSHGSTLCIYGHKISAGAATPTGYEMTGNDFDELCTYIKSYVDQGQLDAVDFKHWYEAYTNGETRNEA